MRTFLYKVSSAVTYNWHEADSNTYIGLLMNHTSVVGAVAVHLELASNLSYLGLPYTLDEVNGMALQGGEITYSMGNALWTADFTLWTAANVSHSP